MSALRFEWDPKKAASNLRKHKVSFEDAQTVFSDERALLINDPDHSELVKYSGAPERAFQMVPI